MMKEAGSQPTQIVVILNWAERTEAARAGDTLMTLTSARRRWFPESSITDATEDLSKER